MYYQYIHMNQKSLKEFYLFFNIYFIYLFIYFGCVRSQLPHGGSSLRHAVSFVSMHGLLSSCGAWTSLQLWLAGSRRCGLCSLWHAGSLQLTCTSSLVVARRISCPTACGILVPQPGIEPTSPALEGRFFTIGPPGKSLKRILIPVLEKVWRRSHL